MKWLCSAPQGKNALVDTPQFRLQCIARNAGTPVAALLCGEDGCDVFRALLQKSAWQRMLPPVPSARRTTGHVGPWKRAEPSRLLHRLSTSAVFSWKSSKASPGTIPQCTKNELESTYTWAC
jgi:hypothetical protein